MPATRALGHFPPEVASHSTSAIYDGGAPPWPITCARAHNARRSRQRCQRPRFLRLSPPLPPPHWLSTSPCRDLPLTAHDACGPVAPSRARRSSATRARRCTSTAPSRSPSPSRCFRHQFLHACVRSLPLLTAPPAVLAHAAIFLRSRALPPTARFPHDFPPAVRAFTAEPPVLSRVLAAGPPRGAPAPPAAAQKSRRAGGDVR